MQKHHFNLNPNIFYIESYVGVTILKKNILRVMLYGLSKNVAALVMDPTKMHYFWRIWPTSGGIFEESEQT